MTVFICKFCNNIFKIFGRYSAGSKKLQDVVQSMEYTSIFRVFLWLQMELIKRKAFKFWWHGLTGMLVSEYKVIYALHKSILQTVGQRSRPKMENIGGYFYPTAGHSKAPKSPPPSNAKTSVNLKEFMYHHLQRGTDLNTQPGKKNKEYKHLEPHLKTLLSHIQNGDSIPVKEGSASKFEQIKAYVMAHIHKGKKLTEKEYNVLKTHVKKIFVHIKRSVSHIELEAIL